jgi:hypothetical protein
MKRLWFWFISVLPLSSTTVLITNGVATATRGRVRPLLLSELSGLARSNGVRNACIHASVNAGGLSSLSFTPNEGPSEEGKITTLQTANRYYGIPLLDVSEFLNHSENSRLPHEVTPKLHPISKLELRSDFTVSSGPSDQVNLNWGCPFQAGQRWAQREV